MNSKKRVWLINWRYLKYPRLLLVLALLIGLCLVHSLSLAQRSPQALPAPFLLPDNTREPLLIWPHLRVYLPDRKPKPTTHTNTNINTTTTPFALDRVNNTFNVSPSVAYEALNLGRGFAMKGLDDDFGRHAGAVWASFSLTNPSLQHQVLTLSNRQTTLEVFELYHLGEGRWQRHWGKHELAKNAFERDRYPSFELVLAPKETAVYLIKTETAAPIKYLMDLQQTRDHQAQNRLQHFLISLTYAIPIALVMLIFLLRRIEGGPGDPLFVMLVATELVASAWLIGLAPELFPKVSGWAFRWFGQIAYGLLLFVVCWHQRKFLQLDEFAPRGAFILRITGWLGLLCIFGFLVVDLRLGAAATLPVLFVGILICIAVCIVAVKRQIKYARTYLTALGIYFLSSFAYLLYHLGLVPMKLFGVLTFAQAAGICIVMSVAVARSVLAKDSKLKTALSQADQQRQEIQLLAFERDRLFAAANHDLRQPLQAVALNLELLRRQNLNPEQQVISARMRLALASMSNMLSSFLDLRRASVSTKPLSLEPVALGPMIDRLTLEYREHARAKGLSLKTVRTSTWVLSDALLLERVLRNLLSNALRYTDQGRVLLGVKRRGTKLAVVVIDSGRGIPKDQLAQLFRREGSPADPHRALRLEQQTSLPGTGLSSGFEDSAMDSYGLGLYIVKTICDRLQAGVLVDSRLGVGSRFQVLLAIASNHHGISNTSRNLAVGAEQRSQPSRLPGTLLRPLAGQTMLVVDDDPQVLAALNSLLLSWGAQVTCRVNAEQAILALKNGAPLTAVICDFDLGPGRHGLEVLRLAQLAQPQAKRVLISGRIKSDMTASGLANGIVLLPKPIEAADLLEALMTAG